MTPAEWTAAAAVIEMILGLSQEAAKVVDEWIHSRGTEQEQVMLARMAANVSVDAYQRIVDAVKR